MADTPVLIVGAGPTGLALALALRRAGITPRIIDTQVGPGRESRAMGVQARTLEFYRQLGFADEVVARGIPIELIRMRAHGHATADVSIRDFGEGLSPYPFVLSFPQDEHEVLLVNQLRMNGVDVEWETELIEAHDVHDCVHATLRKRGAEVAECTTSYLCGCDGARSIVRQSMDVGFEGGTYEKTYFVADVEAAAEPAARHSLTFCLEHEKFMLMLPVRSAGQFRLIGVIPEAVPDPATANFEDIRAFAEKSAGIHVEKVHWFSIYKSHHRVADHFRVGRVFLCGDSGHIHSPVGAQGMNTGIGDAMNLAWKLAAVMTGRADVCLLDSYEPERIGFAHSLVATTDRVFQLVSGSGLGSQIFREAIFPYLPPFVLGFPGMKSAAFRAVSQTKIHYRDSTISEGAAGEVHGGDRLPWTTQTSDNFEPLKSMDWQVHVYGTATKELLAAARDANLSVVELAWTPFACEAGLKRDALYLIRPDGYVGLANAEQDVETLDDYVAKLKIVGRIDNTFE